MNTMHPETPEDLKYDLDEKIDYRGVDPSHMSDAQINELSHHFCYDPREYMARMEAGDDGQKVLISHLYCDHVLSRLLRQEFEVRSAVDLARITFAQKLNLARGLGAIQKDEYNATRKLNNLRNKIAHNLRFQISDSTATDLENISSDLAKKLISEKREELGHLSAVLAVNLVMLEMQRQFRVFRYLKNKKRESGLRKAFEKASEVLDKHGRG